MKPDNGGAAKGRLSRDAICETAIAVIDEVGLEAVSMRLLAGALGVKASSLYHHFGSKDELMTGVAEFLYRELGQAPGGDDWTDQVKRTFLQLRDFIQVHPNAAPLLVRDLARSSVARQRAEVLLRLVWRAGIGTGTSVHLLTNLVALLVGHTLLELWVEEGTGDGAGADRGAESDFPGVWVRDLLLTGQTESPYLQRVADGDGESDGDSAFSVGLDALIGGFATRGVDPVTATAMLAEWQTRV